MMKSFFKKLAFVMALAMVVSMVAPAATTASAASSLRIAYQNGSYGLSEVNIAEVGGQEDLKFLGAPSNWKELGVKWTSNNEAVATVDKAGVVTAVSAGTAEIAVQIGAEVAVVKVNCVNTETYTATIGVAAERSITEKTIEEGDTFDFAFYGIKDFDPQRYFCTWASDDTTVATVDQKGLVTAVKPGTAKITLIVFNKVTGKVHNVTPCVVTVPGEATPTPVVNNNAFTVTQKDTDKFVLTFAEAKTVDEIKENLTVSVKLGEQDFPISFENVTVDGKNVTVTTYASFENDEVYTLVYGKETVEHTIVLGEIASVAVNYYTGKNKDNNFAYVTEEEENDYVTLVPILYDQYGNNVTSKYNLANFDFNYEVSDNVKPVRVYNDVFAFDKAGAATVSITATWITDDGDLKEVTGKTVFAVEKRGAIALTLEKAGIASPGWLASDDLYIYNVSPFTDFRLNPNSVIWSLWGGTHVTTSIPYKSFEDWRSPVYTAVFKDNRGNLVTSNDTGYLYGTFTYESTNNDVLSVEDGTGDIIRNKPGKANILVYFEPADGTGTKKLVASTSITVTPELYPVSYKVLTASQTTASDVVDDSLNNVSYYVQFYDQFGNVYTERTDELLDAVKIEARDTANMVTTTTPVWNSSWSAIQFVLDGSDFDLGTNTSKQYSYKFSLEDTDVTSTIKTTYAVFSLTVKDTSEEAAILAGFLADGTVPANYKFNISLGGNQSVDAAVKNILDYSNTWAQSLVKTGTSNTKITAKYLSSGNLDIAYIPNDKLVDCTDTKVTTGNAGYVYYKVSAPTKTSTATSNSVVNDAWDYDSAHGKVSFEFNEVQGSDFKYAANGSYTTTFYTTRKDGGNLYSLKSSTITVNNTQSEVKYLGLNPDMEGVTEMDITEGNMAALIREQLCFSYEAVLLGEYYDTADNWNTNITFNPTASKWYIGSNSVTITKVAFDVAIDDGTNTYTYTTVVNVGVRIKEK